MSDLIAQFAAILDQASAAGVGSTELLVRQLGTEGELIRRCAITHQFTPEVLRALDPSLDRTSAEQAFHRLARLSLVIRSPDGLALHDRAREELFAGWLAPAKLELLREISTRLIAYLDPLVKAAAGAEQEKLIRRRMFHLIAVDQDAGIDAFEQAFEDSRDKLRYTACDNVLRMVREYDPILTPANRARVTYREAKLALDRGTADRALALFTAVAAEPSLDLQTRAKALNGIGGAHADRCHWKKAALAFLEALQFADQHAETQAYRCVFLEDLAAVYRDTGHVEPAELLLTESARLAATSSRPEFAASVHNTFGTLYLRAAQPEKAIVSLRESLSHLPEDDFARARVYNNLGLASMRVPDLAASEEWFQRSLEMKALAGDTVGQANTHINLVRLYREQRSPDKAVAAAAMAADLFSRVFFWKDAGNASAMLTRFYIEANKPAEAAQAMIASIRAYERAHADEELELFRNEMRRPGDESKDFRFDVNDVKGTFAGGDAAIEQIALDVASGGSTQYAAGKLPWLAALLSLIFPGLGQLYNADYKKAAGIIIGLLAVLYTSVKAGCIGIFIIIPVTLGLVAWAVVDAWRVASGKSRRW